MLYPLSYEGGGPGERIGVDRGPAAGAWPVARWPGGPVSVVHPSGGLGARVRLVYLRLIFNDKGLRDVVSLLGGGGDPRKASTAQR